jgi:hypothetical protein
VTKCLDPAKSDVVALVVHIDEFQLYIDAARKHLHPDPRGFFKEMLKELGTFMREGLANTSFARRFFVIPVVTGTSATDVRFVDTDKYSQVRLLFTFSFTSFVWFSLSFCGRRACYSHL